ncbi:MAG: Crp/Fnr family transcriptional regulator [Thiomonas sp.]
MTGQDIKNGRSDAAQDFGCECCINHGRCGLLNIGCGLADDFGLSIRVEEFCADTQIPTPESCLLVVKAGAIKTICVDTRGRARVIGFSFPGDLIGLEVLAGFDHSCVDYKASVPMTSVCSTKIHPASANRVSPHFGQRLSSELATRIRANYRDQQIVKEAAQVRLAHYLTQVIRAGQGRGGSHAATLPNISRSDIASYLHLRVETVSRTLATFRKSGWVRGPLHCLEVVDVDALTLLTRGLATT